ncbi:MAG TPA: hypothetical protein VN328_09625 [Thermodesulfovibrionales bacterium]|nr:hypothetical protein [Thermodesulfovibrionales bacterium]
MKDAKNVIVRMDGRAFTIEIDISEDEMISKIISSLGFFLSKGFALRITHASKQPLSRSQSMSSRILRNIPELKEWGDDVKRLLRVQGARLFMRG